MSKKSDNTFTLDASILDNMREQITSIDEKLVKVSGTAAERRTKAEAALRAEEASVSDSETPGPFTTLDDLSRQLEDIAAQVTEAKNATREAVDGYLRSQKDESSQEAASLKETRSALVTKLQAAATLLDVTVEIPKAPKGHSSSNGSGVKSSKGTYAYRRDGSSEWTVPNAHQQSISSIAYRVFDKATAGELRSAMESVGVVSWTQDYEATVTVNDKTATVRFEVSSDETPSTDNEDNTNN